VSEERRPIRRLRQAITPPLALALLRASAVLPLRAAHALGGLLGGATWSLAGRTREISLTNLALCLPELGEAERERLGREALRGVARTALEVSRIWAAEAAQIERMVVETPGIEHIDEALASGQGVITAAPHLGAWELVGLFLSVRYDITAMYRPPRLPAFDAYIRDRRQHLGGRLVPADGSGVRALARALKQGKLAGILPDQEPADTRGAVYAPFFGEPALTMTLLPRLARQSGARTVFIFAERLARARGFRMRVLPAPPGIDDPDPLTAATALNLGVEQCVRHAPEQYQWSYKRFRHRPDGQPDRY
jgi:KDO2-lipid IV(A) lauroyltransferase